MVNVLGIIGFITVLVALYIWNYHWVFDSTVIRDYNIGNRVSKRDINRYIQRLNSQYYGNIHGLNFDGETMDDDEVNYGEVSDNTELSTIIIKNLFSLIVSLSIELIILILCELIALTNATTPFFHLIIDSLVILVTAVLPLIIIALVVNNHVIPLATTVGQKLCIGALYGGWFMILRKFGNLCELHDDSTVGSKKSIIDQKISEISIFGITIIAILSGIGSTSTIYKLVKDFHQAGIKEIKENDLNHLIQSYNNTNHLINKRQAELNDYLVTTGGTIYNLPDKNISHDYVLTSKNRFNGNNQNKLGGILHKVQSFASLSSLSMKSNTNFELSEEIKSLHQLRSSIFDDINKSLYKYSLQISNHDKNHQTINLIIKWFTCGFAVYCIYRIINVVFIKLPTYYFFTDFDHPVVNPLVNDIDQLESSSNDALAITISKLLISIFHISSVSETQLINQISFILSGGLFVCSFSNVLMTFKSFGKIFYPIIPTLSSATKNRLKHLFIAQLLSIYVIATCLLIRTNLPTNLSHQISKILSLSGSLSNDELTTLKEIEFIDHWFDLIYAISCIFTLISIAIQDYSNDDITYDEESFVEDKNYKFL